MKSLGDRMKGNYENRHRINLIRRIPVVMRLDGKAFHTLTQGCVKPFDKHLQGCMVGAAKFLCKNVQGAKLAYVQSDEISILLTDFDTLQTDAWFDYNLQKICSVSAAYASVKFTELFGSRGFFDCRAFNVPKEEVCNYFIWRQKDWERNSIQMLSQAHYSPKQLHGKKTPDMHEMLHAKGINWALLNPRWKNGVCISKFGGGWEEKSRVIFTQDRNFVERYLEPTDD